ncbi:MAG TPA: ABC transporter permease [Nitrospirales bacterium]
MLIVAIKNLLHDKTQFAVAVIGVSFSVILMAAQIGVFLGFMENSALMIDNTDGDIWITSKNSRNFDFSQPFPERKLNQAMRVNGVASGEKLIFGWSMIRNPDGGSEQVEVVGFNPDTGIGGPWSMREGKASDVKGGLNVIVDESSLGRLGDIVVGDYREITAHRLKIVGISRQAKSLTTAPIIFTSYTNAAELVPYVRPDETVFILLKVVPGFNPRTVAAEIRQTVDHVDVYTKAEYSLKTKMYWMFETGMGFGFLLTAIMAFAVGIVVVGQTIYSSTIEHLQEFGTLKAIGAENRHIYEIIFEQAFVSAVIGFAVGIGFTFVTQGLYVKIGLALLLPPVMIVSVLAATLLMCFMAGFVSVWKAMHTAPAEVFR